MKLRAKRTIFVISFILIILAVAALSKIEWQSYQGLSIDEVIEKRYSEYQCQYIESKNYYFVFGKNNKRGFRDILYRGDNGKYSFYTSGIFVKNLKSKDLTIELDVFSGYVFFYKDNDKYLIKLYKAFPEESVQVFDNDGQWPMVGDHDRQYWFKVIDVDVEPDYQVYIEANGKQYVIADGKEINTLFDE